MVDNPADIIASAIKILESKSVDKHLLTLIKIYRQDNDVISIKMKSDVPSNIQSDLEIKNIDISNEFMFEGNIIQIIVANMHWSMMPDDTSKYGDIFVIYNGECVFRNLISSEYSQWGEHFEIRFFKSSIKSLKAGNWLDLIGNIAQSIERFEEERARRENDERMKSVASKIDLGEFKI